jgi:hypothetical protein
MIINITHKTNIREIQRKIRIAYPFLKIEFSKQLPEAVNKLPKASCYDHVVKVLDIAKKAEPGWIVLHSWSKSGYLKQVFKNRFGLYIHIFRREDDRWIEITGTDVFTIEEQNEMGRRSVEKVHAPSWREREMLL